MKTIAGQDKEPRLRARGAGAGAAERWQSPAESEELGAVGAQSGHVGRPAARGADGGEEVGQGRVAADSRVGRGVCAKDVARVERGAATQQQLAHLGVIHPGCVVERGPAILVAIVDPRARVEEQDCRIAMAVIRGDVQWRPVVG